MSIFGNKKENKKPSLKLEDLPEFPDVPSSDVPAYKPTLSDIKQEVEKPDSEFQIPKRQPAVRAPQVMRAPPQSAPVVPAVPPTISQRVAGGQPLFVKIDKYKSALTAIDALKQKINEAEKCLKEVEDIRAKEDQKLNDWKSDVQKLKERLLEIDKNLFEV